MKKLNKQSLKINKNQRNNLMRDQTIFKHSFSLD